MELYVLMLSELTMVLKWLTEPYVYGVFDSEEKLLEVIKNDFGIDDFEGEGCIAADFSVNFNGVECIAIMNKVELNKTSNEVLEEAGLSLED